MPLSEFLRMACGKLESDQQKPTTCPTDLSSIPENDFVELVWENGQIKMQGQSSRAKTPHSSNDFPMQTARTRDKYIGNATSSRIGKVGSVEFLLNDASPAVPSDEMDFSQDDDMATWLNYPIDDNLQQDYCPQLLPEVSGITTNEPSNQNSFASMDKRSSCIQTIGSSHNVSMNNDVRLEHSRGTNLSSSRTSLLSSWSSLPGQTSLPSLGSGASDIMSYNKSNDRDAVLRDSPHGQPSAGGYLTMKMPKKNITQPCSGSTLSNFSFLSRHTAHVRAGLHNTSGMATSSSSAIEKIGHKEKNRTAIDSYPVESALLPSSSSRKENDLHNQPSLDSSKVDLKPSSPQPLEQSHPPERSDALCRDDHEKTDASMHQGIGASPSKGVQDGEKTVEPVVASSSVCSGSSADRGSSDQTHNLKRKGRDNEESEYRSEDVEEESLGVKRAAHARGGTGSKRSRAAEVHNLSERRRRDRINEKMRALQELIPNCNKADKASMLDEAIEYLKTLQLQVQIMSMGAGLCMPPMMFPAGMQHLHAAHMPHYPPMGVGMGMGMGFGMGMLDMNGGSPGCPIFPVPPMQRTHFPSPSVSGPANFQGLAGSHLPIFGHPGQGHPMSVPRAPLVPLPGRPPTSSSVNLGAARMGLHVGVPCASPSLNSKDPMLDKNTQLKHNTDVSTSMNESSQLHSTNEGFDQSNQSTLLQKSNQVPDASGKADVKLSNGNAVPSREAGCD